MKISLSLAAGLVLCVNSADALTEVYQITSEKECPANLKISVERPEANHESVVVSLHLAARAPGAYGGRVQVFGYLRVASRGATVFDGHLDMAKKDGGYHCRFRVRADCLVGSHLALSALLYEGDGHVTLEGGEIYEISLGGFAPSATVKPNSDGAGNSRNRREQARS